MKRKRKYLTVLMSAYNRLKYLFNLENGGIASSSGNNTSSTTRVRVIDYIPVEPDTEYQVTCENPGQFKVYILQYRANKSYLGSSKTSGWLNCPATFTSDSQAVFFRIVFAFRGDPPITYDQVKAACIY